MDSSIQSCETNKNFKSKFNATANTKPRRYNKMMCSSWKLTVFGILALMLAFGMTADDVAAQTEYSPVTIAVTGAADLRAAATVATIDFAIDTSSTIAAKEGSVTITIPAGWSRPFLSDATDTRAGAVSHTAAPTDTSVKVSGNQLIFNVKKDVASATLTFSYRNVKLPVRANTYTFNVSSTIHNTLTRLDPGPGITGDNEAETLKGDGRYIAISVGSVANGMGKLELTAPSFTKGNDKYKDAAVTPPYDYEKRNLVYSEQALGNLTFTFTAAGTMYKGSVVVLSLPGATGGNNIDPAPTDAVPGWQNVLRNDNSDGAADPGEVSVTGATLSTLTGNTVQANIGGTIQAGHRIVFTIKNVKAPKFEPTAAPTSVEAAYTTTMNSVAAATDDFATSVGAATAVGDPVYFAVHGKHGTGKVEAASTSRTGDDALDLVLTFTAGGLMLEGSMVQVAVPTGWAPSPYVNAVGGITDPDGHIEVSTGNTAKVANRVITVTTGGIVPKDGTITITYHQAKAPKAQGSYTFSSKASSHKLGTPMAITSPTINVITGHGSGTISLMRGGSAFTQATRKTEVGTLTFVYVPGGVTPDGSTIEISWPGKWSVPRNDNADGRYDEGEMLASPAAKVKSLVLARGDEGATPPTMNKATITTNALTASDRITLSYRNVKVPDVDPRSDTFETRMITPGGTITNPGARLDSSPVVGIGQVPDGSGSITASIDSADAGSVVDMIDFTYTAAGSMAVGAQVEITVPEGWSAPTLENNDGTVDAGESSVSGVGAPTLSVNGNVLTVTVGAPLSSGEQFKVTYRKATVPNAGGSYRFATKSKVTSGGTLTALESPTVVVSQVASGSIALTSADGPLTSAAPGMGLGNLVFTFAAGAQMQTGAQVMVTVPLGWTAPFIDNNDGVDAAGEVSLTGMADLSVSGGGAQPWVLTATTNAVLEAGNTLTFTYKMVTAPAAEATYTFTTNASTSPGATALPLSSQPSVIVRAPVAAIAVKAEPASVFVGDDITVTVDLWSEAGELAKALGDVVVMLSSSSETGSFTDADGNMITSVTIADNTSAASAMYGDSTAGMATITATSGMMTNSVDVEVKSTIRDLVVDNTVVMGGSTIMVSATGKAGGGTVTILDSDGDKVGTKKALDPVDDPDDDGDQEYSRSVTLPATIADGMYTLSVEIQGATDNSLMIEVVNDQTPPSVSNAASSMDVVVAGDTITLSADVAMNESMVAIASVMADLGGLDTTQVMVGMDELSSSPGRYFTVITIASMDDGNTAEDGEYTVTITATDAIGNEGMDTTMVTLANDPSELTSAEVTPSSGKPGETIWIKAMGSAGADASATVNNADSGMMIAQVALDEDADNAGMYSGGLMIVEDAHPAGMYDVTVTLGTQMMTLEDALTIEPPGYDFTWTIGAGTHLIHVPLAVTKVNGADMTISTVRDLYNALGDAVSIIISLGADGSWNSYLGDDAPGMAFGDMMLGDSTGLVAVMKSAVTLELTGNALGTGGVSTIALNAGNNLVGVPLDSAQISMISDVLGALVSAVVVSNEAGDGFQTITQAGDPGDGPLMGGEGYIVVAAAAASIPVIGSPWQNMDGASTAPPVASGANVKTPVLHLRGQLVDEAGMMTRDGLTVSVRNVTSGSVLGSSEATDEYSMTFVKLNSSAAKVGDILEIKADSGNPLLGIRPVQHVVTAEDVLNGSISLPDLVTYEIPAQSELLANYPNPFNPETWIPFRLAEDSNVSLDIYGASGTLVRNIDLGFTPAAVYEGRSDAIYWDGRNNFGEQVSSGLYFYHLRAGEFSATRRMVVVK